MKKNIVLVLAVSILFTLLAGCDGSGDENPKNETFEQLPETDKLVLYRHVNNKYLLDPAIKIFEKTYPDVEIEVRDFGDDLETYMKTIQTEIPAGKGPDLICSDGYEFPDIYKTMEADVFYDLNGIIENDPGFDIGDYNKVVLDSGVYKGKRYVMPISYRTRILITSEERLAEEGIKSNSLKTFGGYASEVKKYLDKYNSTKLVYHVQYQWCLMYFPWCGLRAVDYESKSVNVGGDDFKKVMEAYKDIYWQDIEAPDPIFSPEDEITIGLFQANEILFICSGAWYLDLQICDRLSEIGHSPVFLPFPAASGKTTAKVENMAEILNSSQNKANAYAFLKILLSEQIQGGADPSNVNFIWVPVLNSAVDLHVEYHSRERPKEEVEKCCAMSTDVKDCQIFSTKLTNDIFYQNMWPYFKGEETYENCVNKTRNELELYMSE